MANPFLIGIMGLMATAAMVWNSFDFGGDETQETKVSGNSGGRYGRKDSMAGYGGKGSRYNDHVVVDPHQYDRRPSFTAEPKHKTLVIGVRGFRWDFVDKITKDLLPGRSNIGDLVENGMNARHGIMPVFPTTPVPNLYTIVTGLYPASHEVVADNFIDMSLKKLLVVDPYTYVFQDFSTGKMEKDVSAELGKKVFRGEPIWETAGTQKVACMYWPGCEFGGFQEGNNFINYKTDGQLDWSERVNHVKRWMGESAIKLILMDYRDLIEVARVHGPESDQMSEQLKTFDREIGQLVRRLGAQVLGKQESQLDNARVSDLLKELNLNLIIVGSSGVHEIVSQEPQLDVNAEKNNRDLFTVWTKQPTMWLVKQNSAAKTDQTENYFLRSQSRSQNINVYYGYYHAMPGPYKGSGRLPYMTVVAKPGYKLSGRREINRVENYGDGYVVDTRDSKMRPAFVASGPALAKRAIEYYEMGTPNVHFLLCKLLKKKPPHVSTMTFNDEKEEERNDAFRARINKYLSEEFKDQ